MWYICQLVLVICSHALVLSCGHLCQPWVAFHIPFSSPIFIIPTHCHLQDFVSYVPYNNTIFSLPVQGIYFTPCKNIYTIESKHQICPQILFCAFLAVPHGEAYAKNKDNTGKGKEEGRGSLTLAGKESSQKISWGPIKSLVPNFFYYNASFGWIFFMSCSHASTPFRVTCTQ